jgi:hypothetical protein
MIGGGDAVSRVVGMEEGEAHEGEGKLLRCSERRLKIEVGTEAHDRPVQRAVREKTTWRTLVWSRL